MGVIKHEPNELRKPRKPKKDTGQPAALSLTGLEHELAFLSEILAAPLDRIAEALVRYANNAASGENSLSVFTGPAPHYRPMRLVLEGEAVDRIAGALSLIADAVTTRPA
jgi:hypothetical protein